MQTLYATERRQYWHNFFLIPIATGPVEQGEVCFINHTPLHLLRGQTSPFLRHHISRHTEDSLRLAACNRNFKITLSMKARRGRASW